MNKIIVAVMVKSGKWGNWGIKIRLLSHDQWKVCLNIDDGLTVGHEEWIL